MNDIDKILRLIMDNEKRFLFVISNHKIVFANKAFLDFYNVKDLDEFIKKYKLPCKTMKVDNNPLQKSCADKAFFDYMKSLENKEIEINKHFFKLDIFYIEKDTFVVALSDITNLYNQNLKLSEMANYDYLTGIFNRHKLGELFSSSDTLKGFSCIMFDIDNFKKINDTYGHDVGDEVLKSLSDIVKQNIRKQDIFARWGGEEFVIFLRDTNINEAKTLAEKIREVVDSYQFDKVGNVTISIGVSKYSENDDLEKCIKKADIALYESKRKGKNRVEIYI